MEERNCYVYEDYRMDNWTCCYVGMGSKNEERGYNRFEIAERNDHHDNIMDGCGIARVIIRDNLTRSEANVLEEARIYYYVFVLGYTIDIKGYNKGKKSDSHLTNQTWGGDGTKGYNPYANKTEEEMKEIAKKRNEAWNNKSEEEIVEWKKKMSEAKKGEKNYWYGKHFSEEHRKKIGEKSQGENNPMYGKKHSEETKQKLSELNKGEKNPMYGKGYKISGEKNPMYGRTGEESPRARKVKCLETGEIFTTVKQASEWSGTHRSCIARQIQGKRKSAGKHPITGEKLHWEYVD